MRSLYFNDLIPAGFQAYFFLFVALVLISTGELEAQDNKALDGIYKKFSQAYDQLDPSIIESIYHADAHYLSPDEAIKEGVGHILTGFKGMFQNSRKEGSKLKIRFSILYRDITEEMAYDVGYYQLTRMKDGKVSGPWVGKFVTIFKKDDKGEWKFVVDGYSSAPVEAFNTAKIIEP